MMRTRPTVPGGDTPCVTAGDARRVNPWRELHSSLRHQRCRTASTVVILSTLSVRHRRRRSPPCTHPHGFTLAPLGHHPWRSGEGEKREISQPAPTVPRGDTPCVTAGDAQRANPWRSGEVEKWRGREKRNLPARTHCPQRGHTMRNRG